MIITGTTALVTGANRGLGRHLAAELRDRGARVYAAARDPRAVDLAGVMPIALDITDPASVAAAAEAASGVAILVNNAGSSTGSSLLTGDLAAIRLEMDTHFLGTLAVIRAFTPQLAARGSSAVLNVGYMDTDMTRNLEVPKSDPAVIAKLAIDGIAAGDAEIIADETSRRVLAGLSAGVAGLYPQVA